MVQTRIKPQRVQTANLPDNGKALSYDNPDQFRWEQGSGDMLYKDFEPKSITGHALVISNITTEYTATENFSVSAGTSLKPGIEYIFRVNSGSNPFVMTLGQGISNPGGYSLNLTPNAITQFRFFATNESQLELQGIDTDTDVVTLSTEQTIQGRKIFAVDPVLPAKSTDAQVANITVPATESQVAKKIDKVSSPTQNDIATLTSNGGVQDSNIQISAVELNTNKETSNTLTDSTTKYPSSHTVKKSIDDAIDESVNVKVFTLASASDTTTAQKAVSYYNSGKTPIVILNNRAYNLVSATSSVLEFQAGLSNGNGTSVSNITTFSLMINITSGNVTSILEATTTTPVLATNVNYQTPYTPTNPGNPVTKKYVDENIQTATSGAVSDAAYSSSWNGVSGIAPSKNAVYDKIEALDSAKADKTAIPGVVNNLTSSSTGDALSANQGRVLKGMIDDLAGLGKFLSLWNSETGQPISFPLGTPYTYSTGDYFLVETTGTTNYKPTGASYTGGASTVVDSTNEVQQGDVYIYDGTSWLYQANHGKTVSFGNLTGQPTDNTALANALSNKQDKLTAGTNIQINTSTNTISATDTKYSTATASVSGIVRLGSDTVQTVAANNVTAEGSRTYAVQKNGSDQLVVNVPWTDTLQAIDSALDSTSNNPVRNSVITSAINNISQFSPGTGTTGQILVKTASGYAWADPTSVGIVVSASGSPVAIKYLWGGTSAQYTALGTYNANTQYSTTDS